MVASSTNGNKIVRVNQSCVAVKTNHQHSLLLRMMVIPDEDDSYKQRETKMEERSGKNMTTVQFKVKDAFENWILLCHP